MRPATILTSLLARVGGAEKWTLAGIVSVAIFLMCFTLLANEVVEGDTLSFDRHVLSWTRSSANPAVPIGPVWLREAVRDVTALGGTTVLTIVVLAVSGYLAVVGLHRTALMVIASVLSGVVLSNSLKAGFARARPDHIQDVAVYTSSFPSGHATLSAIVYLTLAALLCRTQSSPRVKSYILAVSIFLTVIVGLSRIYLGVHWATDVIAGWLVGSTWAIMCWFVMLWLQSQQKIDPEQSPRR